MYLYVTKGTERCCVIVVSTLYRYDVRSGDLCVLSCARVRRCALVVVAYVVFIVGAAVCCSLLMCMLLRKVVTVLFDVCWCNFLVCHYVYGVFVVVECCLFMLFESGCCLLRLCC